jgi:CRP/FNR family transcriptional regulator, polysaccharide utilization system transcription regulator
MQYNNPYIEFCLEGTSSVFKGLNQKDKETIVRHHSVYHIRKGELLFKAGDKHRGLICLASGKVKVFKLGVGGREQILRLVKPSGFIGYRALFSEPSWSFSARAIEYSVICMLEKSSLVKILKREADLTLRFLKILSEELTYSNNRLVSLTQKHIRGRLAESLLLMRNTYGYEEDSHTISVILSREDIAGLSNMTTSNAIRTLSNLAAEGSIEIKGKKIKIINAENLDRISELG